MVIDPSRTKTGSQNESVKYRITASLWADKESLDKFYDSKAHLNTRKMQKGLDYPTPNSHVHY